MQWRCTAGHGGIVQMMVLSVTSFTSLKCPPQDRVPPFPCSLAKSAMAKAFGRSPEEVFSTISDRPVAAASLGQVYRPTLRPELGGKEVAVKVLRPGVLEQVRPGVLEQVTGDWKCMERWIYMQFNKSKPEETLLGGICAASHSRYDHTGFA